MIKLKNNIEDLLDSLSKSKFRGSFHLNKKMKNYVKEKGFDKIKSDARDLITKRIAPENPNNDGKVIRLAFPELTEERRKELAKEIRKIAEEAKVAIRAIRRDGIDEAKAKQKNSEITEDELKSAETEIQKITDKYIDEIDKILADKEKEIMSV